MYPQDPPEARTQDSLEREQERERESRRWLDREREIERERERERGIPISRVEQRYMSPHSAGPESELSRSPHTHEHPTNTSGPVQKGT